jgi:hypothetical protein
MGLSGISHGIHFHINEQVILTRKGAWVKLIDSRKLCGKIILYWFTHSLRPIRNTYLIVRPLFLLEYHQNYSWQKYSFLMNDVLKRKIFL